jgi:thiol-disulfide isomerase/thioredoxin
MIANTTRFAYRVRCLALLASLLVAAGATASTGQELAQTAGASLIGTPAPRMVVTTIDGQRIDLGALYGKKAVYLKFWATWCVPCREQMPHFERTARHAGKDLAVIAINAGFNDSIEDVKAYRSSVGLTMPIVIDDGRLAAALRLRVTPEHIVIGRDGRIQYIGHLVDDRLTAALATARQTPAAARPDASVNADERRYGVGDQAPAMSVATLDGAPFALREPGRTTALVFVSPWCESYLAKSRPQRASACRAMREQVESLVSTAQVRWLIVASGLWATREDLVAYRDEHKLAVPLALDESGTLFRSFGIRDVPAVVLVDGNARIARRFDRSDPQLGDAIAAVAAK